MHKDIGRSPPNESLVFQYEFQLGSSLVFLFLGRIYISREVQDVFVFKAELRATLVEFSVSLDLGGWQPMVIGAYPGTRVQPDPYRPDLGFGPRPPKCPVRQMTPSL